MADYEVSFDSRINIEQIAEICNCTDLFVKNVSLFTEKNKQELSRIQRINSLCSPQIITNYQRYSDTGQSIFFIGGITTRATVDIAQTAKYILKNSAYRPVIINGVIYNNQDGNAVVVERKLIFLPVNLRIIISGAGSFLLEVVVDASSIRMRKPQEYIDRLNQNAIEKFIVDYVIPLEVLPAIGSYGVVYVGSMGKAVEREYDIFSSFSDIAPMRGVVYNINRKMIDSLSNSVNNSTISNSEIVTAWIRELDDFDDFGRLFRNVSYTSEKKLIVIVLPHIPLAGTQYQIKEKIKVFFAEKGRNIIDTFIVPYDFLGELITLDEIGFEEKIETFSSEVIRRIEEQNKQEDRKDTDHELKDDIE